MGWMQIGQWTEAGRFKTVPAKFTRLPAVPEFEKNRTFIVTTYMVIPVNLTSVVIHFVIVFAFKCDFDRRSRT